MIGCRIVLGCWASKDNLTIQSPNTHTGERGKESIHTHTSRCIEKKASIQSHLPRTDRQQSFSVYTTDPLLLLSPPNDFQSFSFSLFLLLDGFLLPAEKRVAHCYHHTLAPIGIDIRHPSALYRKNWKPMNIYGQYVG